MIRPLRDYIVVKPDEVIGNASTVGILIAPRDGKIIDSQSQFGRTGTVVAVGPGRRDKKGKIEPLPVIEGDRIMWGEFIHPTVDDNGDTYFVIRDMDITAVLEKQSAA